MTKISICRTWCLTLIVAQASVSFCSAQVQLDWKLPEGSCWRVEVAQSTLTATQTGGRQNEISMETAMELQWVVDEVDADGSMHVTQTCRRFRLKSISPDANEPIQYDSASSREPAEELKPIAGLMRPLIGMRHHIVLSRRGEILNVVLPSETESLLGDLPAMSRWKKMLTKDGINQVLRQSLGVLPKSAVNIGDRWTSTQRVDSPFGELSVETTYQYEGTRRRNARTLQYIRAVMKTTAVDEHATKSLADRLRPEQQAVYYFDSAQACLAESHLRQTVRSEVSYAGATIGVLSVGTVTLRVHQSEKE